MRGISGEFKKERERPSRTLFVRNISYEVTEEELRPIFEKYGEIKKFFNRVSKRGMAFITYVSNLFGEIFFFEKFMISTFLQFNSIYEFFWCEDVHWIVSYDFRFIKWMRSWKSVLIIVSYERLKKKKIINPQ